VVWSDECSFELGKGGTEWVTHTQGERFCLDCIQFRFRSGSSKVMIWGAIGYGWKSDLVFLEGHGPRGGVTIEDYRQQVLEPIVEPSIRGMREWGEEPLFMEDGATVHGNSGKGKLRCWKLENGIVSMSWPPSSPDFNPIEKVWRILKQRIKHRDRMPRTMEELKKAICDEWDRLDPREWDQYIESMPDRMKEGCKRHGLQTQY